MKIELSNDELIELVEEKIFSMGFMGNLTVSFLQKRGGIVDTVINIGGTNDTPSVEQTDNSVNTTDAGSQQHAEDSFGINN